MSPESRIAAWIELPHEKATMESLVELVRDAERDATAKRDALIAKAQDILREWLKPDSFFRDDGDTLNELLELFDGPAQRDAQSRER